MPGAWFGICCETFRLANGDSCRFGARLPTGNYITSLGLPRDSFGACTRTRIDPARNESLKWPTLGSPCIAEAKGQPRKGNESDDSLFSILFGVRWRDETIGQ